jgi:hypothetical protein
MALYQVPADARQVSAETTASAWPGLTKIYSATA